jgi:quercetin dioxygenase-like cupin family protein
MTTELLPGFAALASKDIEARPWEAFGGLPHVQVKYLLNTPNSVSGLMRIDAGAHVARHVHVDGQHHVWVAEGVVLFAGKRLDAGSYLHAPAGMSHTMEAEEDGCTLFFVFLREA